MKNRRYEFEGERKWWQVWKMGETANGGGNGALAAVELPERSSAPPEEPQPVEEEVLVADTWEELDAAYKMDSNYQYPEGCGDPVPYDPEFKGPVVRRSCTDFLFLILFICFLLGWGILAALAFKRGDINRVIFPTDSSGNICGTGAFETKPNLFFFDLFKCKPKFEEDEWIPSTRCRTPQVCVEKCPTKTFSVAQYDTDPENVDEIKEHMVCIYGTDMSKTLRELSSGPNAPCAYYYIASTDIGGRCVPSLTSVHDEFNLKGGNITVMENGRNISGNELRDKAMRKMERILNARKYFERFLQDLTNTWRIIIMGLVCSMMLALGWIILMRLMADMMVWMGILGILALLLTTTIFSWQKYFSLQGVPGADEGLGLSRKISYYTGRRKTWLILGILSTISLSILVMVIMCLRERVRIATALIKEAAKAIGYMPTILLFPVLPYLLELMVALLTAVIALSLMSLAPSSPGGVDIAAFTNSSMDHRMSNFEKCIEGLGGYSEFNNKTCMVNEDAFESHVSYWHLYNILAFFWVTGFIVAFGEMTIATAVASYYWTREKNEIPSATVVSAMWTTSRYHMGTLAFGSLIITIVAFIRMVIAYIEAKLKKYENDLTKMVLKVFGCLFWCLENFLRFVNRNAYIMTGIYGESFCTSARRAFHLLMRNIVRVIVVDKVTDFLLLASKLVVVGITTVVGYYIFSGSNESLNAHIPELNYPLFPVFLLALGSYVIATCFFDVFNMAVDTLFLCFLEDCERHDGSKEKPYFMSKELMLILKKRNESSESNSSGQNKSN